MATQAQILRAQQNEALLRNPLIASMLDTIAQAEGTHGNYNQIVGERSGSGTITDFSAHPGAMRSMTINGKRRNTSAAGRYQFTGATYRGMSNATGMSDFSPHSQDINAIELLRQTGAVEKLLAGDLRGAITAAGSMWEGLPGALVQRSGGNSRTMGEALGFFGAALKGRGVPNNYVASLVTPQPGDDPRGVVPEMLRSIRAEAPQPNMAVPMPAVPTRSALLDNLTEFMRVNTQASLDNNAMADQLEAAMSPSDSQRSTLEARLAELTPRPQEAAQPQIMTNPAEALSALAPEQDFNTDELFAQADQARSEALQSMFGDSSTPSYRLPQPIEVSLNRIIGDEFNG